MFIYDRLMFTLDYDLINREESFYFRLDQSLSLLVHTLIPLKSHADGVINNYIVLPSGASLTKIPSSPPEQRF